MVQSIERAFKLLEILDLFEGEGGINLSLLGKEAGLKLPTIHNMLKTLVKLGYTEQSEESGKYRLSEKAKMLGRRGKSLKSLSEAGEHFARKINAETDESVVLAFYSSGMWRTLLHIDSKQPLTVSAGLNFMDNLYVSATGRCIMASLSEVETEEYLARKGLPGKDWEGVASKSRLLAELAKIRESGIAGYRAGHVAAIATPVNSPKRGINAALGLYMPEVRFDAGDMDAFVKCLRDNARALTEVLDN